MKAPSIYVMDFETDPFDGVTIVKPFCVGFYDGAEYTPYWGDDCVDFAVQFLRGLPENSLVYAHNGGRFDFFFFLDAFKSELRIVNGRVMEGSIGNATLRDSWGIFPDPLAAHDKGSIDYERFAKPLREGYRREILDYLRLDCVRLYEICARFHETFGNHLTIGGTSLGILRDMHPFKNVSDGARDGGRGFDAACRPFYYGGRNQCFAEGIVSGDYKIYDVNSMYPFVMKTYAHPISSEKPTMGTEIGPLTGFARVEAFSKGALPVRTKTGIDFPYGEGVFSATIHEIMAGIELGLLEIKRVHYTLDFERFIKFDDFVDEYYTRRLDAKAKVEASKKAGDRESELYFGLMVIFWKKILISPYGKLAQNPENYEDWRLAERDEFLPPPWRPKEEHMGYRLWTKPSSRKVYFNVATAASITGAARAHLLRGLVVAEDPVYCDTDSIICRRLPVRSDPSELGAWKLEGHGDEVAIAGKKLYAVFDGPETVVKHAGKGVRIEARDIRRLAEDPAEEYTHHNIAPTFKLGVRLENMDEKSFIHRRIRRTAKAGVIG